MSISVKNNMDNVYTEFQNSLDTEGDFEEYQDLISAEEKFEEDIREVYNIVQESPMMSLMYDEETRQQFTLDHLRNWKATYGKIYVSSVTSDPMIYVWRPLLYLEYKAMVGTSSEQGSVKWEDQFLREEAILKKCLLFPKPTYEFLRNRRAGVGGALSEQILFQSGFVPLEFAVDKIRVIG